MHAKSKANRFTEHFFSIEDAAEVIIERGLIAHTSSRYDIYSEYTRFRSPDICGHIGYSAERQHRGRIRFNAIGLTHIFPVSGILDVFFELREPRPWICPKNVSEHAHSVSTCVDFPPYSFVVLDIASIGKTMIFVCFTRVKTRIVRFQTS